MKITKRQAVERMVKGFDAIPHEMVRRSMIGSNFEYLDDFIELTTPLADYEDKDILPMWGTMWIVDDLGYYMDDKKFIQKLSEIGFRVYDTEFGYMLGIDGAGYDFYEAHWTPLYDLLELNWHK